MKRALLLAAVILGVTTFCFAEEKKLLIDDFEISVSGGPDGTVDFGAGNGSMVEVTDAADIKNTGDKALKVVYDAVDGGYIYVARGTGLDAKNAAWSINPADIKWEDYSAISFYIYGTDSKTRIAFDIKDNGGEIWRFITQDDFNGWKRVVCSFDKFMVRDDWQPQDADNNGNLDFPIKIFQFEPLSDSKGTLYFDTVELVKE